MTSSVKVKIKMEQMSLETAVNTLIGAANFAQSKGVFTLKDAAIIQSAIEFLLPESVDQEPPQVQTTVEDVIQEEVK